MKALKLIRKGLADIVDKFYPYRKSEESEYGVILEEETPYRIVMTGFVLTGIGYTIILQIFPRAPTFIALMVLSILFHAKEDMIEETKETCRDLGVYE